MKKNPILLYSLAIIWTFITVDLNNINIGNESFEDDDLETIVLVRLIAWRKGYKQHKACKKNRRRIDAFSKASNVSAGFVYPKEEKYIKD